jgi:hypothetical protein
LVKSKRLFFKKNINTDELISFKGQLVDKQSLFETLQNQMTAIPKEETKTRDFKSRNNKVPLMKQKMPGFNNRFSRKQVDISLKEDNIIIYELKQENKKLKRLSENYLRKINELTQQVVKLQISNLQGNKKSQFSEVINDNEDTLRGKKKCLNITTELPKNKKKSEKTKKIRKKNKTRTDG